MKKAEFDFSFVTAFRVIEKHRNDITMQASVLRETHKKPTRNPQETHKKHPKIFGKGSSTKLKESGNLRQELKRY